MLKGNKMNFIKNFWQKRKKMILWATGIGCVLGMILGFGIGYLDVDLHPMSYWDLKPKTYYNFDWSYFLIRLLWFSFWGSLIFSFILNILFLAIVKISEIIKKIIEGDN
jgi:hypothetical protein